MQVSEAHLAQRFKLLGNNASGKEFRGFVGGKVHNLSDVEPIDFVGHHLGRIAQSAAGLAGCLDGIHKGHIVDNDSPTLTYGTSTLAVEGKEVCLGLVGAGEKLADVVGNVKICGWSGTEADANAFLAYINYIFVVIAHFFCARWKRALLPGLAETLHQRTLARARNAGNAAHHAQRKVDRQIFQVMQSGVLQMEEILWGTPFFFYMARLAEHRACKCLAVQQFLVAALKDDLAAVHSCAGAHIYYVVGNLDYLLVVLDEDDGVAVVLQFLHRLLHQQYVVVVQTHAGLVEDVHHVREGRIDVFGYLAALCLAAREGAYGAVERKIAKPDFLQRGQSLNDGTLDVLRKGIVDLLHPLAAVADAHRSHLCDVDAVYLARANLLVEACSAAVGTGAHRQHRVERCGVQQSLFRVDDAAVHSRYKSLILCRFGPV